MNPDQTPWEQSDLGPYCLQYRLPKNIRGCVKHTTKVVTGRLGVKPKPNKIIRSVQSNIPVCPVLCFSFIKG